MIFSSPRVSSLRAARFWGPALISTMHSQHTINTGKQNRKINKFFLIFFFSFNPTGLLSMKVVLASLLHSHWAPQDGTLWKPVYWLLHQDHPQNPMRFSFKQSQEVSIAGKCWSSYFLLLSSNLSLKVIWYVSCQKISPSSGLTNGPSLFLLPAWDSWHPLSKLSSAKGTNKSISS